MTSPAARAAEAIANALGGGFRLSGGVYRVRCPAHLGDGLNCSISNGRRGATIVVRCHSHGCDPVEILRAITALGGGERDRRERPREHKPAPPPLGDKPRWLFDKALSIKGTPAERYLTKVRGSLIQPPHDAVRFMPARPPKFRWPVMVSLVTDFADANRVLSLHFTDLLPDGSGKAPTEPSKHTLAGYPVKGGVVRLVEDAEVTTRIGVAEGIETALAVMTAFRRDEGRVEALWCALNAGNLGDLHVLPGIETLVIYADRGLAGEQAADKLSKHWIRAGRDVFVATAPHDDWNPKEDAS